MTRLGRECALLALVLPFMPLASAIRALEVQAPDPMALLRGVEASRDVGLSARFRYRVRFLERGGNGPESLVDVAFQGKKYQLVERKKSLMLEPPDLERKQKKLLSSKNDHDEFVRLGLGRWENTESHIIVDGSQVLSTNQVSTGAQLISLEALKSLPLAQSLDPRTLGLTVIGTLATPLSFTLGYPLGGPVTCVGLEPVLGQRAWHVRWVMPGAAGVERHWWISDSGSFRVFRFEVKAKGKLAAVVESEFHAEQEKVFPRLVRIKSGPRADATWDMEAQIEELSCDYAAPLRDEDFTLAALGLPRGVPITDLRVRQVVGYWDGERITSDVVAAFKGSTPPIAGTGIRPWIWWGLLAALGILLLGACAWWWRRQHLASR